MRAYKKHKLPSLYQLLTAEDEIELHRFVKGSVKKESLQRKSSETNIQKRKTFILDHKNTRQTLKREQKMKKALIFDFFGTLVSTPESLFVGEGRRTWYLLKKYDYEIKFESFKRNWENCLRRMEAESNANCVEFHFFKFVRTFLQENFPSKSPTFHFVKMLAETFLWEWNRGVKLFDESTQVIHQLLTTYRLGLISNTHYPDLVYRNLAKAGFSSAFDVVVTSVEFGIKKPDRRIFEHTAFLLGVKTRDCIYVGDDLREDYEGAINAGMEALLIDRYGKYRNFTGNRISQLMELISWLAGTRL